MAPPGNARRRPGNSAAPPRGGSRLESHAVLGRVPRLPKCAGRGRDRRGLRRVGAGGRRALPPPRGSRGFSGTRIPGGGGDPARLRLRQARGRRPTLGLGGARRCPQPGACAPPPRRSHPLSSAPSRPGTAPDLTLARRVRRAKRRELTGRGGLWRASGGSLGRGRREAGTEWGKATEEYAEDGRRQGTRRGGGWR